jgi:hypothetical protein
MNDVSQESIASAKAAMQAERDAVFEACGVRITDEGCSELSQPARVVCICGPCKFVASAQTDGRALRSFAAHAVRSHGGAIPVEANKSTGALAPRS